MPSHRKTNRWAQRQNEPKAMDHTHAFAQAHTHADTGTQTPRHPDTQCHRHTDTQTHINTDTHKHRHTDTQTHRHTDTHTMQCKTAYGCHTRAQRFWLQISKKESNSAQGEEERKRPKDKKTERTTMLAMPHSHGLWTLGLQSPLGPHSCLRHLQAACSNMGFRTSYLKCGKRR